MFFGSREDANHPSGEHITRIFKTGLTPFEIYRRVSRTSDYSFFFESSEGKEKLARFSIIGFNPVKRLSAKGNMLIDGGKERKCKDPLREVTRLIPRRDIKKGGFFGGAVGYFSYDYVRNIEKLPDKTRDDLGFPDFEFGIFEDCLCYDHRKGEMRYFSFGRDREEEIRGIIGKKCPFRPLSVGKERSNISREEFEGMVLKAKGYILNGDIFQVVLSKRYSIPFEGDLLLFYRALKEINPSPYLFYLKFGDRQVIGSSPENLVRVEGRRIDSYATIAGTRSRGKTPEEDDALEKELLCDEKERAEHLMLVDLARNDVGRVAEFSSILVPEFMTVHKYSHVQHIVSRVVGRLRKGKTAVDGFRTMFPAGTVSGAPKVRAMEIIDELEPVRRGPYAGAVGYFSSNGNCDFAITIRTLFTSGNEAYVQSGCGIVFDSNPEREFVESEDKAKALIKALRMASKVRK